MSETEQQSLPGAAPADAEPATPATRANAAPATAEPDVLPQPATPVASAEHSTPAGPAPAAPAAPVRSRRVLGAVARWTAAVLVCGGLGAGTAAGITAMERTDVPGLATASDGRWDYPKLRLPALPEGSPRPFTPGNEGEIHHADLRALVLPAPAGATVDPKADGGWVSVERFLSLYPKERRGLLREAVADSALRHVAGRAWTMPDGTKSAVYLLRFKSVGFSESFKDDVLNVGAADTLPLDGTNGVESDSLGTGVRVDGTALYTVAELAPYGPEQTRWAYIQAGDTLALVVQSRKGGAAEVPFRQTFTLQNQLLG
ncbi:hypothetical protein [Streptomyces sp. NPDC056069]|uniref:hypothetical protein n=1 Tax=Streptomyces sp. NPDC056069 TaxID=3345702 RepID=UPI0035D851A2